ncbi:bactofilin family protein [Lachnoclostridium phytofermentans]|nr:polymer-forming cytoskeletal protein [Lachnoclostridium phytofermentans]
MGFFKDFINGFKKSGSKSEKERNEEAFDRQNIEDETPDVTKVVIEEDSAEEKLEDLILKESAIEVSEDEINQEIMDATEELLDSEAALLGEEPLNVHREDQKEQTQSARRESSDKETEKEEEIKERKETEKEEEIKERKETGDGENTMVDFEESVVDEELLDTLLNEEEKAPTERMGNTVQAKRDLSPDDKDAVTVISKGTTINGSIVSDCSLNIMGTVIGDIECQGKLSITGRITGNSIASEIEINAKRLEGSLNSEGNIKIDPGTVIIGDVTASSGQIAGAVKGEVDINGPVLLDATAIVKGNVKAKSMQMNNGAVLEGFISLAYASVNVEDVFKEK